MISDYGRVLARDLHSGHQESAKKRARGYSTRLGPAAGQLT